MRGACVASRSRGGAPSLLRSDFRPSDRDLEGADFRADCDPEGRACCRVRREQTSRAPAERDAALHAGSSNDHNNNGEWQQQQPAATTTASSFLNSVCGLFCAVLSYQGDGRRWLSRPDVVTTVRADQHLQPTPSAAAAGSDAAVAAGTTTCTPRRRSILTPPTRASTGRISAGC